MYAFHLFNGWNYSQNFGCVCYVEMLKINSFGLKSRNSMMSSCFKLFHLFSNQSSNQMVHLFLTFPNFFLCLQARVYFILRKTWSTVTSDHVVLFSRKWISISVQDRVRKIHLWRFASRNVVVYTFGLKHRCFSHRRRKTLIFSGKMFMLFDYRIKVDYRLTRDASSKHMLGMSHLPRHLVTELKQVIPMTVWSYNHHILQWRLILPN